MNSNYITIRGISSTMDIDDGILLVHYKLVYPNGDFMYETAMFDEDCDTGWVPAAMGYTNELLRLLGDAEKFDEIIRKIQGGASRELYL